MQLYTLADVWLNVRHNDELKRMGNVAEWAGA